MKRLLAVFSVAMLVLAVQAQMADPVHFSSKLNMLKGNEAEIVFSATIDPGWHVYSTEQGQDGPIEATFNVVKMDGAECVGKLTPRGNVIKHFDNMFGMELKYFEKQGTFVQKIRFTKPKYVVDCYLEYGACNDEMCMPPTQVEFKAQGESPAAVPAKEEQKVEAPVSEENKVEADVADTLKADTVAAVATPVGNDASLWEPSISELRAFGDSNDFADHSLLYILLMGFLGGLLAVCMPCIWPIIPMTVSFFLKRAKTDKQKGIRDAMTYGVSIIVIYLGLGLLVTALFGSDTLNAMSTNAVFNIFLFLLLVVFALSFFGWFEIKLPDSWANAVDSKASATSGLLSIFLMAFTLVLVSFSCTAPIIGLLLV